MKNNQDPKYPTDLFWMGFCMNMTKNFFLFFPAIILIVIGIFVKSCFSLGLALLIFDAVISLAEQIRIRNGMLNDDNPNFKQWKDAILSSEWRENIEELLEDSNDNDSEDSSSQ